jgi:hypothetical protein
VVCRRVVDEGCILLVCLDGMDCDDGGGRLEDGVVYPVDGVGKS